MIIFFDTETNGLPKNWNASMREVNNWPRVVQLAWALYQDNGVKVNQEQYIIKPDGWTIPEQASSVHGITTERAMTDGVSIQTALSHFNREHDQCHTIVAHNIKFDHNVLGAEMIRANAFPAAPISNKVCTMLSTTNIVKAPGNYGYKWPKLEELHRFLFGRDFEGAHEALVDVIACADCFFELKKRALI